MREFANRFAQFERTARNAIEMLGKAIDVQPALGTRRELSDEFLRGLLRCHNEYRAEGLPPTQTLARARGRFGWDGDAERALAEILAQLGSAAYVAPAKLTVERFLVDEWLPTVERTLRPLSYVKYEQVVRLRIVPNIGQIRLQGLSAGQINGLYAELEQTGLSASTQRLTYTVLHRALRDAVRLGRLVRNPAGLADPPARARARAQAWTASELARFLEHVGRDRLFFVLAPGGDHRCAARRVAWRHLARTRPRRCPSRD